MMTKGTRTRELLMLERDGKLTEEQAADIALVREAGRFPPALQGPPSKPSTAPRESYRDVAGARAEMVGGGDAYSRARMYDPTGSGEVAAMREGQAPGTAYAIRTLPGMAAGAVGGTPGAMAGYGAGEYLAQKLEQATGERERVDPLAVGIATAVPAAVAGAGRLVRGVGRTLTRTIPSLFERAQGKAAQTGAQMVEDLRPNVSASQLAQGAEAAGQDIIALPTTRNVLRNIKLPPDPANPKAEAVAKTVSNLRDAMGKQGQDVFLADLEAIRKDIGPLVGREGAEPRLRALYASIIRDLEKAAESGSPGAAMAREAATAFKQEMGASRVADLLTQASPTRVISGANVPALNIGTFGKLIREPRTRESLAKNLGPEALKVLDRFVYEFRALPPDVAFNGWNRMVLTLGGAGGGMAVGGAVGNVPGAILGALTPEILTNMALVGKNPQQLQQLMTAVVEAARAGAMAPAADEP
jgi:hypothetical protein